jgi:hypothetical protein
MVLVRECGLSLSSYEDEAINSPVTCFWDALLLILVYLIWGIGACTLAPGGPREAQWGNHRVLSAGSKMNCSTSTSHSLK